MVPLVVNVARGSPGFESLLVDPPTNDTATTVGSNSCVDCYDCDYNCEECDTGKTEQQFNC